MLDIFFDVFRILWEYALRRMLKKKSHDVVLETYSKLYKETSSMFK